MKGPWKSIADGISIMFSFAIPFDHEDIRAYVDTFFLEGSLTPIVAAAKETVPAWCMLGYDKIHRVTRFDAITV